MQPRLDSAHRNAFARSELVEWHSVEVVQNHDPSLCLWKPFQGLFESRGPLTPRNSLIGRHVLGDDFTEFHHLAADSFSAVAIDQVAMGDGGNPRA